jgi:hypothetical protein
LNSILNEEHWKTIFEFCYHQLTNQPEQLVNYYKARLMGVFLSAFYLQPVLTIRYLVHRGLLDQLVSLIISKSAYFISEYDRKLLVLGLSSLFSAKFKEQQLDDLALRCLECSILTLHVQRIEQNKQAGFYKSRVIKTSDETDELKLYSAIQEKFKAMAEIYEEEFDDDDEFNSEPEDEADREEMEVLKALMSNKGKANISLKNFNSEILKANEFDFFINILKEVKVGSCSRRASSAKKTSPSSLTT